MTVKLFFGIILITLCIFQNTQAAEVKKHQTNISEIILADINSYRAEQGLPALQMSTVMSEQATMHSRDMANHTIPFSHDGFRKRFAEISSHYSHIRGASENVAYVDSVYDAHEVVKMWIRSSGHRRNIEGNYNLTGIGIAYGEHKRLFVTEIFLRAKQG